MNHGKAIILTLFLLTTFQGVFAGDTSFPVELPEPVFYGTPEPLTANIPVIPVPGLLLADFQELVFLWTLDPEDGGEHFDFTPLYTLAAAASSDASSPVIPLSVRNNQYYIESLRLTKLAQESFDYGDYDASTQYAAEAQRYAQLSDEYVALQLKIKETNDAISAAKKRLDWAVSIKAGDRYPQEFKNAQAAYDEAIAERAAEHWDLAIAAANRVINFLAYVQEAPAGQDNALPAQYTVRPWAVSKDCLWNIAGRPWAYGDPTRWRIIYNANKAKMPQPDNPDLIHPGMILDIPSIKGEVRQGMWDSGKTYQPLR